MPCLAQLRNTTVDRSSCCGEEIERLDPDGIVSGAIAADRVIGCIVYPSASIAEPGVLEHVEGNRFAIGEPDGSTSDRCRRLASALIE